MLYKLVQFIKINIGEKLAGHVSEGNPLAQRNKKALHYNLYQPKSPAITNRSSCYFENNTVIDGVEELPDVAFERISRISVIAAHSAHELFQPGHSLVSPFSEAAEIGIKNEFLVEIAVQYPKYSLKNQAVPYRCLVDMPQFRIADVKRRIFCGAIDAAF